MNAQVIKDIYDFEPNKVHERNVLPRKMRYYHGLIDTKLLGTGTDYEKLPNVYIIMLLPYDPFDKKRMVYTIKNQCVEDTSVSYEDGATKMFLYTKGTQGNPGQNLIDILKYIENLTEANVVNQDIATIHSMVTRIKQNKEVGINYMKSWEWERIFRNEERFILLCEMIQEERISIEEAARKVGMTVEEFTGKMRNVVKNV